MQMVKLILPLTILAVLMFCCPDTTNEKDTPETNDMDPFEINSQMYPGINLGNALEAPEEGDWGVTIQDDYFQIIKNAGFNHVRIPIRWSAHAAIDTPYTVDVLFMNRVKHIIDLALINNLYTVINIHHYEEIFQNPAGHKDRFLALWHQIGAIFRDYPSTLVFEILNEPHDNFTSELWNQYFPEALNIIRETNPKRTVIIGTAGWGGINALEQLQLPADDDNLIVTIHYYEPFTFTHQGAEWVAGTEAWLGTTWSATLNQVTNMKNHFDQIKAWADEHNRPIYLGEFGAYGRADIESRRLWTGHIVSLCRQYNFSWAYWEFCSGFGAYDASVGEWNPQLLSALIQAQ